MKKNLIAAAALVLVLVVALFFLADSGGAPGTNTATVDEPEVPDIASLQAELTVTVVDIDGEPVADSSLTITAVGSEGQTPVATRSGSHTATLAAGDYIVTATADGYTTAEHFQPRERVHLTESAKLAVELVLRKPGSVSGTVLQGGVGVPAKVSVREMGTGTAGEPVETAADGLFTVTALPGRVRLYVSADGSADARSREIAVADGAHITGIDVELSPGGSVVGAITSSDGATLSGEVQMSDSSALGPRRIATAADGTFRIDRAAVGDVRLTARVDGYEERVMTVVVEVGSEARADFVLDQAFGVFGSVTRANGDGGRESWVILMHEGAEQAEVSARLGKYRIDVQPPPGSAVLAVDPHHEVSELVTATAGAAVDLVLRPGGMITGVVRTEDRQPISMFRVGVESFDVDGPAPYSTNEFSNEDFYSTDGSFEYGPLRPGTYQLRASADGYAPGSSAPIVVRAGGLNVLPHIVLVGGGTITGRVTDPANKPIAAARVGLFDPSTPFFELPRWTDEDGVYTITGVPPGRRSVYCTAKGHLSQVSAGLEVPTNGEVVRDIVLERGGSGEQFQFHGIGAVLTTEEGGVTVVEAMDGRPASIFGIQAGDSITAVDGLPTEGMRLDEVIELIRGEEGIEVELDLERGGERLTIKVERGRIVTD